MFVGWLLCISISQRALHLKNSERTIDGNSMELLLDFDEGFGHVSHFVRVDIPAFFLL